MKAIHLSLVGASLLAGCATSGGDPLASEEQHQVLFHGELEAFPGFGYDSGTLPAASPVQLQLQFSASGKLIADAVGTSGGSAGNVAVAGVPGSGVYKLDAHLKAAATLHVHIDGLPGYDGPIPGIENLDIALAAQTTFDPFLLGGSKARLDANLPETELPPIPLGSVPGKLIVTISSASTINSNLWGVCAGVDQGQVQFLAEAATSATIVLKPKIVISVPFIGDQEFLIPEIRFDTGQIKAPFDLGTVAAPEGGDAPTGVYMASNASCAGVTCKAPTIFAFTPSVHPSMQRNSQCSTSQLYAYIGACVTTGSTKDACDAFLNNPDNLRCGTCMSTDLEDANWGVFVEGELNRGGCIALVDPSQSAIAEAYHAPMACQAAACNDRCEDASAEQYDTCVSDASQRACASYDASGLAPTGAAAQCMAEGNLEDTVRFYGSLFCGAI